MASLGAELQDIIWGKSAGGRHWYPTICTSTSVRVLFFQRKIERINRAKIHGVP